MRRFRSRGGGQKWPDCCTFSHHEAWVCWDERPSFGRSLPKTESWCAMAASYAGVGWVELQNHAVELSFFFRGKLPSREIQVIAKTKAGSFYEDDSF